MGPPGAATLAARAAAAAGLPPPAAGSEAAPPGAATCAADEAAGGGAGGGGEEEGIREELLIRAGPQRVRGRGAGSHSRGGHLMPRRALGGDSCGGGARAGVHECASACRLPQVACLAAGLEVLLRRCVTPSTAFAAISLGRLLRLPRLGEPPWAV
jgi:hypothetical protein